MTSRPKLAHLENPMRRTLTLTAAAATLLALTACSSNDTPDAGTKPATASSTAKPADPQAAAKAELEKSVRAYTAALFSGDADTGYALVSARCQDSMPKTQFSAMSESAHHDYGSLQIKTFSIDNLSGDLARVSYGVGVPQFERKAQPWAKEDGTWKWDACPSTEPSS